ncbi:MAG: response regulator [Bacteroidales bacterium]|nr:response regulator [Bacteroidales bacterium]MBN2761504.1 response regulator [Bacteroidales bacterium]
MEKIPVILYAEDNLNDIELTLAAFRESNLANQVDVVRDGEEVLDYLFYRGKYVNREKSIPVFVLLDLKMPKLDGIETLKKIRASEEYRNLPVVMLTSSQMESDVYKSYQLGVNGFVVKPIDFADFVKAIKGIGYFWAILNTSPCKL